MTPATARGPHAGKGQVSGFNAAGAWKVTRGDPGVTVAILDTGINWDNGGLRDQGAAERGRAAARRSWPTAPTPAATTCNGNGCLDVDDYKDDPRRGHSATADTGQDLINGLLGRHRRRRQRLRGRHRRLGLLRRRQRPGGHLELLRRREPRHRPRRGGGRAAATTARARSASAPSAQFVPLRVWDTFVSDQNNFFMAVTYATDNGVEGDRGRRRRRSTTRRSRRRRRSTPTSTGVAQVYSGDDLNTGNHNYPAAYDHTMLIQGVAADVEGLGHGAARAGRATPPASATR